MPDYDALLSQQRNVLLGPQQPTTREALRAGIQSTTGTPYAENRANIMAEKYNRALSGYQILSNERDFETRKAQQLWERAQAEADRGDRNFQMLLQLSSAYGASPADSQSLAATVMQRAEAEDLQDPSILPGMIAEEAQKLGMPAKTGEVGQIVGPGSTYGSVDPVTGDFDPQYVGPTQPSGGVTIVNTQEKEYEKRAGEALLDAQVAAQENLTMADRLESSTAQLGTVLQRAETGSTRGAMSGIAAFGEDLGMDVPAVAGRLGINIDDAADSQTIQRLSSQLVLDKLSELPDARPSDKDMEMIERANAGLLRTREDNLRFIEAVNNSIKRIREAADIARESETWGEYQDRMAEWRSANPIASSVQPLRVQMPDGRYGKWDEGLGWYLYEDTGEELPRAE